MQYDLVSKKLRRIMSMSYIGPLTGSPISARTHCLNFYTEAGDSKFLRILVPTYTVSNPKNDTSGFKRKLQL